MNIFNRNQQGAGGIKLLLLIPLVLIGLVVLFYIYTELNKAYWDRKVRALCEKDGGVTVFEKVELSTSEYLKLVNERDVMILPSKNHVGIDDPFFIVGGTKVLRSHSPSVYRVEEFIVRKEDGEKLGSRVSYGRRGGDFPTGIGHETSFSCSKNANTINFYKSVITQKGV